MKKRTIFGNWERWMAPALCWMAVSADGGAAFGAEKAEVRTVHQQRSWILSNGEVELALTQLGGHMAPVTFYRGTEKPVQPYHISPWQAEPPSEMPVPVLTPLRGDFFCLPFGGNSDAVNGEKHPPHGEVAGSAWRQGEVSRRGAVTTLRAVMDTQVRRGRVIKELSVVDGQNVVYSTHTIEGFAGKAPLGHHATLAMPEKEESVLISTSPRRMGQTCPGVFSDPKQREYQSLLPGAVWQDLAAVPSVFKTPAVVGVDRLPARRGYADLVQVVNVDPGSERKPAWTTAVFTDGGYLWFSLKDASMLNSTVFWIENHGRHGHPWNGRNNCLGLEDVTAFFADGLKASTSSNELNARGVRTAVDLSADRPTLVRYIQGVVKTPAGFGRVRDVEFSDGRAAFVSESGQRVEAAVRHQYLWSGDL